MARKPKVDETVREGAIGLYSDALGAARRKDIAGLSWALLETSLNELNMGETPTLGKSIIAELVKNLSANVRKLREVEKEDKEEEVGKSELDKFLLDRG